jgi:glyoxylase-like metal-dependent hydrolase (beta-lactamase superfamily II)
VRVVAVHPDVIVAVSGMYATTCTAVRGGDEALVIDSPVLPDELESLPAVLEQARFPVRGLLATHADWDHLLGRLAFPDAALGVGETTAARLRAEPGAAQRELRAFDDEHYVERRRPLSLGAVQALPVPGRLDVGDRELELHPADGHTADGMAIWMGWARVLAPGDLLSPVEIPMLSPGGSVSSYRATLERLRPLVEQADTVVSGHGGPIDGVRAAALLREDLAYLDALERDGADAPLPLARRSSAQRRIHAENVSRRSPYPRTRTP